MGGHFMSRLLSVIFRFSAAAALLVGSLAAPGCGSSSSGPTGGPVAGALDTHCKNADGTQKVQEIGMCMSEGAAPTAADADVDSSSTDSADSGEEAGADASEGTDATDNEAGEGGGSDYGETLYNSEGDDDDCKYHVKFTVTTVRKGDSATFTLTVTRLQDGKPATGSMRTEAEVFLTETHPSPSAGTARETGTGTGVYVLGPVKFDMSGRWQVRFHLFDNCQDAEDSPHGHAAFYVDVP
jgi:hypothetical protein